MNIYELYELRYVKHFNQILKFLARNDYPAKYIELHEFILSSLTNLLAVFGSGQIVERKHILISLLSTVKIVIKEYASKRLSHSDELFTKYISQLIKVSYPVSEKIN